MSRFNYEHTLLDEGSVVDRNQCHMAAMFGVSVGENMTSNLRYTG